MRWFMVALLTWSARAAVALACSSPDTPAFEIVADPGDVVPPEPPRVEVLRVKRGKGPEREGCSQSATSCDGTGYVDLSVADHVEGGGLGYVLEIRGDSPDELARYTQHPIQPPPFLPGELRLVWEDGEGGPSYDFEIEVWSVDRAGNMSASPTTVHVESGGDGCATRGATSQGGWLVLLVLAWAARRRGLSARPCVRRA
jgi:hypothetical protein